MNHVERGGNSRLLPQAGNLVPGFQIPVILDTVNTCIFETTTTTTIKNKTQIQTYKRQKSPQKTPCGHQYLTQKGSYLAVLKKTTADVENTAWKASAQSKGLAVLQSNSKRV